MVLGEERQQFPLYMVKVPISSSYLSSNLLPQKNDNMLLKRSFYSPHPLVVGNAPLVGVLDLPSTNIHRPPLRLFFPADLTPDASQRRRRPKQANYFVNNRVAYVLQGFASMIVSRHDTRLFKWVLRPLMWLISLFAPPRYLKIPETVQVTKDSPVRYVPPTKKQSGKQSLVVFSHGLTGTGEENSVFCTSLAKRGYVVACIHHRDGSSARVPMPDGTCMFYEHHPTDDDYQPKRRLDQVKVRAKEMLTTCHWLLGTPDNDSSDDKEQYPLLKEICNNLESKSVFTSGFSYGAATSALAATMEPNMFQCAILLDGWFHIDFSSRGIEFDFPPEAFGKSSDIDNDGKITSTTTPPAGLSIPAIFINSSQFQGYSKLYAATNRLADQINKSYKMEAAEMHVIPNTMHQNFCDIVFWLPRWALRRGGRMFAIGSADAYEVHQSIMDWTVQFLDKHAKKS